MGWATFWVIFSQTRPVTLMMTNVDSIRDEDHLDWPDHYSQVKPWRRGLVLSYPPASEETGAMGRDGS
jgi:hypothetical protein